MTFGEALNQKRVQKGWTLNQMSIHLGISLVTLHGWERSNNYPTLDKALRIARRLELNLMDMTDGEEVTHPNPMQGIDPKSILAPIAGG